jgi:hypothetical protein
MMGVWAAAAGCSCCHVMLAAALLAEQPPVPALAVCCQALPGCSTGPRQGPLLTLPSPSCPPPQVTEMYKKTSSSVSSMLGVKRQGYEKMSDAGHGGCHGCRGAACC